MKKRRPTIKEIEDFAFELHCVGLEKCMAAHPTNGQPMSAEQWTCRGKAHAYKWASEQARKLTEVKTKEKKE